MSSKDRRAVSPASGDVESEREPLMQRGASPPAERNYRKKGENLKSVTRESPSVVSGESAYLVDWNNDVKGNDAARRAIMPGQHTSSPDFARSFTSDCVKSLNGKVTFAGDDDIGADDDKLVRRLSSGDRPHWLSQVSYAAMLINYFSSWFLGTIWDMRYTKKRLGEVGIGTGA